MRACALRHCGFRVCLLLDLVFLGGQGVAESQTQGVTFQASPLLTSYNLSLDLPLLSVKAIKDKGKDFLNYVPEYVT